MNTVQIILAALAALVAFGAVLALAVVWIHRRGVAAEVAKDEPDRQQSSGGGGGPTPIR